MKSGLKVALRTSTALMGLALAGMPAGAIVVNDNYTTSQIVDTTNVTGVGQMVVDELDGYLGLCTATLINPRTVIFAAHCVNEKAPTDYGAAQSTYPIGFFFSANNLPGIRSWYLPGDGQYQTNRSLNAYNASYVTYNTKSLDYAGFLASDVAMAALDTPATNVPQWTLLFSPLTSATHTTIVGYGNNGTAATGSTGGIDYRRRVAENTISMLGTIDDLEGFIFGETSGLSQNLYWMDFNDPKFGTAQANVYDFNIFHDSATTKEAITAAGDSGGPLIVDQLYNKQVVAGVLSGGYTRFFTSQKPNSYGTASFYQPLYLFWDWIVTNNPYKYVAAKAGDGSWTDPSHWVMTLDPNYATASGTTLTNALPTTPALGTPPDGSEQPGQFGQVCYFTDCVNAATGELISYGDTGSLSASLESLPAKVAASDLIGSDVSTVVSYLAAKSGLARTYLTPQAAEGSAVINGVSIQGAPGSSNFVPNNTDGDPTSAAPARYYDVTLSAAGTTTISGADIAIDRLTINGANTGLTIASDSSLHTMIDATMFAGNLRVNGLMVSEGDLALMGGVLSGSGTVAAPYTTAVVGGIAPGTAGTVGKLTIMGNLVLSSGSGFLADVSTTGSDLLDVYGEANLGGTLVVSPVSGYVPKYHDKKSVLYANTITGAFDSVPDSITGILYPTVATVTVGSGDGAYQAEVVTFEAASYASLSGLSADQKATGKLLDDARAAHYGDLQPLYDAIDPLSGGAQGSALENLAPDAARTVPAVSALLANAYSSSMWEYIGGLSHNGDAHIVLNTSTLKLAQNSQVGSYEMRSMLTNLGAQDSGPLAAVAPSAADSGGMKLPKGWGGFLNGQVIDGIVAVGGGAGKADVSGWLVSLGLDMPATERFRAGLSIALGEADADLRSTPAGTKTATKQVTFYGQYDSSLGFFVSGFAGMSVQSISTERQVAIGASTFTAKGHASGTSGMVGLQIGTVIGDVLAGEIRPSAGFQYARPDVGGYTETGSAAAMTILPYTAEELDLRLGFDANWKIGIGETVVKPDLHLFLVNAASANQGGGIRSTLAAAPGTPYNFTVADVSSLWAEVGLGAQVELCDYASLGFHFNANPGRGDASYAAYSGSLKINF